MPEHAVGDELAAREEKRSLKGCRSFGARCSKMMMMMCHPFRSPYSGMGFSRLAVWSIEVEVLYVVRVEELLRCGRQGTKNLGVVRDC